MDMFVCHVYGYIFMACVWDILCRYAMCMDIYIMYMSCVRNAKKGKFRNKNKIG